jgi:Uroporphyrinogen decarboxylase (URO-D)
MNERERLCETLLFGKPDKIPFDPGEPRESTLEAWHRQGLPREADWRDNLMQVLGIPREPSGPRIGLGVSFGMLPRFEEQVLERRGGHCIVQDWTGAIVEIADQYDFSYLRQAKDFVTRKWHRFPVQSYADWEEKIRWRYDPRHPERFPADWEDRCRALRNRDYGLRLTIPGPFWQLREWCGLENLCILMIEDPDLVRAMIDFWADFVLQTLEPILARAAPDYVQVSEDMAYKMHSMISPAMARRFLLPTWDRWIRALRATGCPILSVDSDGYIAELIPVWIEAGFNHTWPVEVAAGNDIVAYRRRYGKQIAFGGGIDKRALAAGGETMRGEVLRVVPPLLAAGGYIPGCDHGVPPDVSWQNYVEYTRLLAQLTGWL